jgi:hypothetical protein
MICRDILLFNVIKRVTLYRGTLYRGFTVLHDGFLEIRTDDDCQDNANCSTLEEAVYIWRKTHLKRLISPKM